MSLFCSGGNTCSGGMIVQEEQLSMGMIKEQLSMVCVLQVYPVSQLSEEQPRLTPALFQESSRLVNIDAKAAMLHGMANILPRKSGIWW